MLNLSVPDQRILRGVSATLQVTMLDQYGSAADAAGAVTVHATRGDGTDVLAAGTAATRTATGVYTTPLTAAQAANLDLLTAVWTDAGDNSTTTTLVEIAGGFYFSVTDVRAFDAGLTASKYPDAIVLAKRQQVEDECEWICDVAFVPRYRRVALNGSGESTLNLPDNMIRAVRSVRTYTDPTTYTSFTAAQLAALDITDQTGIIQRTELGAYFVEGRGNLVIEYEHGYDRPTSDLREATLYRMRNVLNRPTSGVPDTAQQVSTPEGESYRLDSPSTYKTGIPNVDGTYARYSMRERAGTDAPVPASRPLNFDPQYTSLFHLGRR